MSTSASEKIPFLRDPAKLAILYQLLTLAGVGLLSYYLVHNTLVNLSGNPFQPDLVFLTGKRVLKSAKASFRIRRQILMVEP